MFDFDIEMDRDGRRRAPIGDDDDEALLVSRKYKYYHLMMMIFLFDNISRVKLFQQTLFWPSLTIFKLTKNSNCGFSFSSYFLSWFFFHHFSSSHFLSFFMNLFYTRHSMLFFFLKINTTKTQKIISKWKKCDCVD